MPSLGKLPSGLFFFFFFPKEWLFFSVNVMVYVEMGNDGNPVIIVSSIILYIFVAYFSSVFLLNSPRS